MINTKIICTIGPVSNSYEMLEQMAHAGMNIVRLNMSHGTHESHGQVMEHVKKLNETLTFPLGILLDTKGPEIRTGDVSLDLQKDATVEVSVDPKHKKRSDIIYVDYPQLIETIDVGKTVTIDNGLINLEVLEKSDQQLQCKVIDGGFIKGRRHVNLPGIPVKLPNLTEKDKADILFGLEQGIDFIALSFVRNAATVQELRELMGDYNRKVRVIAKIENQEGVENLEEILETVDGIMVARGDLGVEIDLEDLPHVQRQIAALCGRHGKRLIIATHLLETMIDHPIPTRAEVTDVTNAIYEESDGIMLSGETTVGKYPLRCIELLRRMAKKTEDYPGVGFAKRHMQVSDGKHHLMTSAAKLAMDLEVRGIVVLTRSGKSADYVSSCRSKGLHIFAITDDPKNLGTLSLSRGVFPLLLQFDADPEKNILHALELLKETNFCESGEKLVVVSDIQLEGRRTAAIQVRRAPGD